MKRFLMCLSLILLLGLVIQPARAQDTPPTGPVYIIQLGDTLWDIAQRFGVSMDELIQANHIVDPSTLKAGDQLLIPGLEGIQGVLETRTVSFGETLRSLSRHYQVDPYVLVRLNRLVSPLELYAGLSLVIPQDVEAESTMWERLALQKGQSLLELAIIHHSNPWNLADINDLPAPSQVLPGDVLLRPGGSSAALADEPMALPSAIQSLGLDPGQATQGKTVVIRLQGETGLSLQGNWLGHNLAFFADQGGYVALQGVHAMTDPGIYPFLLSGVTATGETFALLQGVSVLSGQYFYETLQVPAETLDPNVTQPEDAQWTALAEPVTPEKMWQDLFQSPVAIEFRDCWPSVFGNRRSYNGSPYNYFHTGLDFCGQVGHSVFAPAPGVVVFTGPLIVRGNAIMVDHGWGVYTGYMHLSEISVEQGQILEAGQQIGLVGKTGRVTGPHLHWEVWVGGVQVDPLDWLQQAYP